MSTSERRSFGRRANLPVVVAYVLGVAGVGSLVGTLLLMYQMDQRQKTDSQDLTDLQGQLASVQEELGEQKQDNAVLSNRLADLEDDVRTPDGDAKLTGAKRDEADPDSAPVAEQYESRLADLEAKVRSYDVLEADAEKTAQQIASLEQQISELKGVAEKYDQLQQDFESQGEKLTAATDQLESLNKRFGTNTGSQTVLRAVVDDPVPMTTITTLPEITSFPPADTFYPSQPASSRTYSTPIYEVPTFPYSSPSYYWP